VEDDTLHLTLREGLGQHVEPHLLLIDLAIVEPGLESTSHLVVVHAPQESLDLQLLVLVDLQGRAPDVECADHVLPDILTLEVPHHLEGLVLGSKGVMVGIESGPPLVEHFREEVLAAEILSQLRLLDEHLNWLKSLLMPLLESNLLLVVAKTLEDGHELLQSAVALVVEFAVREEFVHGSLLPLPEHSFKPIEE